MNPSQPILPLDAGLVLRPAVTDDARAILDLVNAISQVDEGKTRYTLAQIHASWDSPGFDLASDSSGVFDRDRTCLGAAEVYDTDVAHVRPTVFVGVHPAFRGTPIGRRFPRVRHRGFGSLRSPSSCPTPPR